MNAVLGITIDFSTNLARQWEALVLGVWGKSQYLQTSESLYKFTSTRVSRSRFEPHDDALALNDTPIFEDPSKFKYAISAGLKPVSSNGPLARNNTLPHGRTYKYIPVGVNVSDTRRRIHWEPYNLWRCQQVEVRDFNSVWSTSAAPQMSQRRPGATGQQLPLHVLYLVLIKTLYHRTMPKQKEDISH